MAVNETEDLEIVFDLQKREDWEKKIQKEAQDIAKAMQKSFNGAIPVQSEEDLKIIQEKSQKYQKDLVKLCNDGKLE